MTFILRVVNLGNQSDKIFFLVWFSYSKDEKASICHQDIRPEIVASHSLGVFSVVTL